MKNTKCSGVVDFILSPGLVRDVLGRTSWSGSLWEVGGGIEDDWVWLKKQKSSSRHFGSTVVTFKLQLMHWVGSSHGTEEFMVWNPTPAAWVPLRKAKYNRTWAPVSNKFFKKRRFRNMADKPGKLKEHSKSTCVYGQVDLRLSSVTADFCSSVMVRCWCWTSAKHQQHVLQASGHKPSTGKLFPIKEKLEDPQTDKYSPSGENKCVIQISRHAIQYLTFYSKPQISTVCQSKRRKSKGIK